jgi:hypothetical protein
MITIGYSTRETKPDFQEYLRKSCGNPKVQIIEKINNGEKNLSQTYNEIISESEYDIVVLCHDDIYFDTNNWGSKLVKTFEKNPEYGILGMAGTTHMPKSGMWWEDRSKMYGIVNHESEGKKWESRYSDSFQNSIKEVVEVDGVFIALQKQTIKETFDESVPGFHMYDINFCFKNFINDVKIGVITNIRLTHKSIGMTNEQWDTNKNTFAKNKLDAIVFPTVPKVAMDAIPDSSSLGNFLTYIQNTDPGSNAGIPGLQIPLVLGSSSKLPVGIELDGPSGSDRKLIAIGLALESLFGRLPPPNNK